MSALAVPGLRITRVGFGDPDVALLVEQVQAEYVERYGSRDDSPLDPVMFDPPHGSFHVAHLDGEPVATGAWREHRAVPPYDGLRIAEIKRMYVAPAARGRGVARVMLAHLEQTARAAAYEVLVLETGLRQPEAIALYESAGYEPVPGFGHYRDSPLSRCFGKPLR